MFQNDKKLCKWRLIFFFRNRQHLWSVVVCNLCFEFRNRKHLWSVALCSLYFELRNRKHFLKCCRMQNSTTFLNFYCRWNSAIFGKSVTLAKTIQRLKNIVVGETVQNLAKVLLKVCASSRVATLWNNISLTYKLSIPDSEKYIQKSLSFSHKILDFIFHTFEFSSVLYKLKYRLNYPNYSCVQTLRQFRSVWKINCINIFYFSFIRIGLAIIRTSWGLL